MAEPTDEDGVSRLYDSNSDDGPAEEPASEAPAPNAPVHPMLSFQGAFGESIIESIEEQTSARQRAKLGAKARRQKMLETEEYDETYNAQWRNKPQAKFHPLWKLMAQISFGVHLLQQQLAKSDEEVVKILQKHVDEVDAFLERTTEDFDLSNQDITERTNHLRLPLEHIDIFDIMLDDQKFRADIIDGNRKIYLIVTRTDRAMNDALVDVSTGVEAVTELSSYLSGIGAQMAGSEGQTSSIYDAMKANTEGWFRCLRTLQTKGNALSASLVKLGTVLSEMSRRADAASKRAASRHPHSSGPKSIRSTGTSSPAMLAPTSKYSSAHAANAQGKPLPPPPRSGSSTPLRLETPNLAASRSGSRGQSPLPPPSPRSPGLYQAQPRSPLANSPRTQSPQVRSPLAASPRPTSPSAHSEQERSPFEGKFESVRAAPKPPGRKGDSKSSTSRPLETADGVAALSTVSSATSSMRASTGPQSRTTSVKRSGSLIKRLRRNLSKDSKSDARSSEQRQPSSAPQKHERSMTSDLADLFQVTGVNDSPRNSYVDANSTSPKKHRSNGLSRISSLRSSKAASAAPSRPSQDTRHTESPTPDSAYSSGEKQPYPDPDDLEVVAHRKRLDRFLGDASLVGTGDGSSIAHRARHSPPKRSLSPGLPRPLTPMSQLDESDDTTPRASTVPPQRSRPASPVSLIQPSPLPTPRPQSPASTFGRPQTPTQRSKFGLFPSNRPLTPSAMSYTSEAPSHVASPARTWSAAAPPYRDGNWAMDGDLPPPGVPRSRAYSSYSNTSSGIFKNRELVGSAAIVSNRDEKKRGGLGRLRHWVSGRKETGGSRLRN